MRESRRSRTSMVAILATAILLGACQDNTVDGVKAAPQDPNKFLVCGDGCGGGGSPPPPPPPTNPGISAFSTSTSYFELWEGQSTYTYSATFTNSGSSASSSRVDMYVVQGGARAKVASVPVNCGAGSGILPSGACSMNGSFIVSSLPAISPALAAGFAGLELDLAAGGKTVSRTLAVSLVPGLSSGFLPSEMSLVGPSRYDAEMDNVGPNQIFGLSYQLKIIQGSTVRTVGNALPQCPSAAPGLLLATSTCDASAGVNLSANNAGSGTIAAGTATLQASYMQGSTVFRTLSQSVLIRDVHIASASVGSTSPVIEGGAQPYTVTVVNNSAAIPFPDVNYMIVQGADTALAVSPVTFATCAENPSSTSTSTGTCTINGTYQVGKTRTGTSFRPGAARLLLRFERSKIAVYDTTSVPINLVSP